MNLQNLGRAQLAKMTRLGGSGSQLVTFSLFNGVAYDPTAGQNVNAAPTVAAVLAFCARESTSKTKSGAVDKETYRLVFPDGILPRRPSTQDEVTFNDGTLYKVTGNGDDPSGVQCILFVIEA